MSSVRRETSEHTRIDDVAWTDTGGSRLRRAASTGKAGEGQSGGGMMGRPPKVVKLPPAAAGRYTSLTFLSGRLRTGLPVAAKIALRTAGVTTEIVGSPTPPQKSCDGTITVSTFGISARRRIG